MSLGFFMALAMSAVFEEAAEAELERLFCWF